MLFGREAQSSPTRGYLLIPVEGTFQYSQVADSARQLVHAASSLTHALIEGPVEILAVNSKMRRMWRYSDGMPFRLSRFAAGGVHVLMNVGFLLSDTPPITVLIQRAREERVSWCGAKSSHDTHACAFTLAWLMSRVTSRWLWRALTHLTACIDDDVEGEWQAIEKTLFTAPSPSHIEHSPAMRQVRDVWVRRWADSPRFLNTAFKEIISRPQSHTPIGSDPSRMAEALAAQRNVSRVPWVFNTLLNEIEYRLGSLQPRSVPPEIHLSLTGRCNIECRFCHYTHDLGRLTFVEPAQVAGMDFLRHVQILRLNSGLGEPTLNRHLPSIIEYVSTRYPHVILNFFTNGLTLHRAGLIDAIVGNVRWINVSLNAASRESWKAQCKSDHYERVCSNVRALHRAKRSRRALGPLVYGSMVLTRASVPDLPYMPALCRELGIDRFVAIPYFGLGYHNPEKYRDEMALATCRDQYNALYWQTVREAEIHEVSLEAPLPSDAMRVAFGLEVRGFYDFARIETYEWTLGRFLSGLQFDKPAGAYCHFLWQQGCIGNTNNTGHAPDETHYMYPCLGPLAVVDLSRTTAFRFPEERGFVELWQGPLFSHLRRAQHDQNICEVCDFCRQHDTRDPKGFAQLEAMVTRFSAQHWGVAEGKPLTIE
jgi:molybdenum cofactor biosynthesis enzyme MoaA